MMNTSASRPPSSSTPVPLLPPPSGYRFAAAPAKSPPPAAAQFSPESTPLALLIDREKRKDTSFPAANAAPPPVKGTGGLTAQDLSFFEGL